MTSNARDFDEARSILRIALEELDRAAAKSGNEAVRHAQSAAWRIADGSLLLARALAFEDIDGIGITQPTGRGAQLPQV